jgi:hypothetical protein
MFKENDIVVKFDDDLSKNPTLFKVKKLASVNRIIVVELKNDQEVGEVFESYDENFVLWNDELKQKIEDVKKTIASLEEAFSEFSSKFSTFRDLRYDLGTTTMNGLCHKLIPKMEDLGWSSSSLFC